jgi:hypothetical protein
MDSGLARNCDGRAKVRGAILALEVPAIHGFMLAMLLRRGCPATSAGMTESGGAIIELVNVEHVPEIKRDRSYQIHFFGFT